MNMPPRSSTTPEPASAPRSPIQRYSPSLGPMSRSPRPRNFTDNSLETVTELSNLQGAVNFLPGSPSTVVSPISIEDPHMIRRRPVGEPNRHGVPSITMPPLAATISHPISPPTPDRSPQELIEDSSSVPTITETSGHERPVSLTGANLQDRLNRPVPPVPNTDQQTRDHPGYIPPKMQLGQPGRPELLPSNRNSEPFIPMNGQSTQHAPMLYHQVTRDSPRSSLNLPNGVAASHGWGRTSPSPQSIRAGGQPNGMPRQDSNSPTFGRNMQVPLPNVVARSPAAPPSSAGSGISPMVTQSTPNLHQQWSHPQQQAHPQYQHAHNVSYGRNSMNLISPPAVPQQRTLHQSAYMENHQAQHQQVYPDVNGDTNGFRMGLRRSMAMKKKGK